MTPPAIPNPLLGQVKVLSLFDKPAKKALKQVLKGGDLRAEQKPGKVGRLALVCLDPVALKERKMAFSPKGMEVSVTKKVKTETASSGGGSSVSFDVEVLGLKELNVEPRAIQLEPYVKVRVSDL